MAASTLINHPCYATYCGKRIIVTPRKRVVMGGRWDRSGGRRVYYPAMRWLCTWSAKWTDSNGMAHIIVREGYFSAWQLERVGSMVYESEGAA